LLPGGEAELFDGVHLPAGVGLLGAARGGRWFASWERGRLGVAAKAALQGACAGQVGEFGVEGAESNEQVGCPPGRMLLMQGQGALQNQRQRCRRTPAVSGVEGGGATLLEGAAQAPDGPWRQLESGGDGGRVQVLLLQREQPATQGEGQGWRHGTSRRTKPRGELPAEKNSLSPGQRPNLVSQLAAKPDVA